MGGVDGEGEGPEVVGVAGLVGGGGDADFAAGSGDAFGFAEVFAEVVVDGLMDGVVFVGLEELSGEVFGDSNGRGRGRGNLNRR